MAPPACPAPFARPATPEHAPGPGPVPVPGIVVAPDLSPADWRHSTRPRSPASPAPTAGRPLTAAILARTLGLPAVVGAGAALLAVPEGTLLAVDGDAGTVTVAPAPQAVTALRRRREALAHDAAAALAAAASPAVTRDGVRIQVEANIAGPHDAPAAVAAGADGVGLLRTEFLFLGATALPDEEGAGGVLRSGRRRPRRAPAHGAHPRRRRRQAAPVPAARARGRTRSSACAACA